MMKITVSILLLICLSIMLLGCQEKAEPINKPVTFYFSCSEFDHGNENSVIAGETRESAGFENDIMGLLNLYLSGPESEDLRSTFPADVKLLEYRVEDGTAILTVTDQLSLVDGIELTVACACIAKTVMKLSGLEAVKIQTQTVNLGNKPYIIMDQSTILLLDDTEIHP